MEMTMWMLWNCISQAEWDQGKRKSIISLYFDILTCTLTIFLKYFLWYCKKSVIDSIDFHQTFKYDKVTGDMNLISRPKKCHPQDEFEWFHLALGPDTRNVLVELEEAL